jgi:hypothetical protein
LEKNIRMVIYDNLKILYRQFSIFILSNVSARIVMIKVVFESSSGTATATAGHACAVDTRS